MAGRAPAQRLLRLQPLERQHLDDAPASFDPVGPPFGFALYHNSASATDNESGQPGQGFTLGRGWSTSYSGRLVFNSGTSTTVIEDDGTKNVFTLVSGFWTPPTGVHDRLSYDDVSDPNHPLWILTRPSSGNGFSPPTGC